MNRICIIIPMLLMMSLPLFAQTIPGSDASFLSGDQKMVRMAVDSSIYIVRQEYTLTNRNGHEYGRNGRNYFGKAYSVGVVANNKIWTDIRLSRPWDMDGNYDRFRAADSIRPRLSTTFARQVVTQPYYTVVDGDTSLRSSDADSGIIAYQLHNRDSQPGITLVSNSRDRGGWLVVVAGREDIGAVDTTAIWYTIYKAQPQFTASGTKGYLMNMPVKDNVIGGIYYLGTISLGKVTFVAAGILGKDKRGWYIQLLPEIK